MLEMLTSPLFSDLHAQELIFLDTSQFLRYNHYFHLAMAIFLKSCKCVFSRTECVAVVHSWAIIHLLASLVLLCVCTRARAYSLFSNTCTQWVLKQGPCSPPHSLWREEFPFELGLFGMYILKLISF